MVFFCLKSTLVISRGAQFKVKYCGQMKADFKGQNMPQRLHKWKIFGTTAQRISSESDLPFWPTQKKKKILNNGIFRVPFVSLFQNNFIMFTALIFWFFFISCSPFLILPSKDFIDAKRLINALHMIILVRLSENQIFK